MPGSAAQLARCPYHDAATDFDPFEMRDPFPFYEWARAEAPVFFSDELKYFVVARHAERRQGRRRLSLNREHRLCARPARFGLRALRRAGGDP